MPGVTMKVEGLQALQAQLLGIGAELGQKKLAAAARKAFAPVIDRARQLAPTWSGALRDAIKLTVKKPKGGELVVAVGMYLSKPSSSSTPAFGPQREGAGADELPPARRYHFVEFGTVKMAAHPFIRPAFDANVGQIIEILKAELVKGIARAVKAKGKGGGG